MKKAGLLPLSILISISCIGQDTGTNIERSRLKYKIKSETTFSLGYHNRILSLKDIQDGNYLLDIQVVDPGGLPTNYKDFLVKINQEGDTVETKQIITPNEFPSSYIEFGNYYYGIRIDSRTMGGYSKDFLNKYDKNWNLIWSKNINKPKWPDGNTIIRLIKNNRLLVIANEWKSNNHQGITISKYDLNGSLISSKLLSENIHCNPISITQSNNSYFLTADKYNDKTHVNSLWMIKLNTDGDTIWSKTYQDFYPKQTILTAKNELVIYGSNYPSFESKNENSEFLKVLMLDSNCNLKWQKEINRNWYESSGNMIETKDGHFLFSSFIIPTKDNREYTYLFELDENGDMTYENKFEYSLGTQSIPLLLKGNEQVIMISQKWIGKFGEPFHDIILLTKLSLN